jgi:hypothetical protein
MIKCVLIFAGVAFAINRAVVISKLSKTMGPEQAAKLALSKPFSGFEELRARG